MQLASGNREMTPMGAVGLSEVWKKNKGKPQTTMSLLSDKSFDFSFFKRFFLCSGYKWKP